jgi:hypothetical protein
MANCRKEIPAFANLNCTFESGGINALAFVTEEKALLAEVDPTLWSDPAFWTSETYTGDILIHQEVSGSYAPSDATITGKGSQFERNIGCTHTLECQIESVKGNDDYWNALIKSDNYRIVWVGNYYQTLFVGTQNARISGRMTQEQDRNTLNEWLVTAVWSDIDNPGTYDVPTGIFQ